MGVSDLEAPSVLRLQIEPFAATDRTSRARSCVVCSSFSRLPSPGLNSDESSSSFISAHHHDTSSPPDPSRLLPVPPTSPFALAFLAFSRGDLSSARGYCLPVVHDSLPFPSSPLPPCPLPNSRWIRGSVHLCDLGRP